MKDLLALAGVVSFALGVLLSTLYHPVLGVSLFVSLLSVVLFFTWFFARRDWYLLPCILLLALALGSTRVVLVPKGLPREFLPLIGTASELPGQVVGDPDMREASTRLTVQVSYQGVETKEIVVIPRFPTYEYGDLVVVKGKLQQPAAFETDGGRLFAYDAFLAKDGIFGITQFAHVEKTGESTSILVRTKKYLYGIKHAFGSGVENALPEPEASLAEGLLVGGKQGLGKELLDAFTVAGLLPIIVLSGYNVMIVAEGVLLALSFVRRRAALMSAGIIVFLFVLTAGGGSSAIRAGLMAGLALYARATHRQYQALRILLVVFVVMLLWNPLQLVYDPGFQFSFAATLGLILLSPSLTVRLQWIRFVFLREIIATTLSAQLFVLPLLLYQTGNLSLVSVPANVLELPVIPITMLLSFVAGAVGVVVPALAVYAGIPAYIFLSYLVNTAQFMAQLPLAHIILPAFSFFFVVGAYALIAWLVMRMRKTAQAKPVRSFT